MFSNVQVSYIGKKITSYFFTNHTVMAIFLMKEADQENAMKIFYF